MLSVVQTRRLLLIVTALAFAAVDLLHKVLTPAEFHHARTPFVAFIMGALITALVMLVPKLPSNAAAVGAGIACGGALGNLVSVLTWSQGVPDPLVIAGATRGIAFNLADLFAISGDAVLLTAVVLLGTQRRAALRDPV
jgi:lipoprotein signal peptidase